MELIISGRGREDGAHSSSRRAADAVRRRDLQVYAGLRTSGVAKRAARLNATEAFMHGARIPEHGAADYAARMVREEATAGMMVNGAVAASG